MVRSHIEQLADLLYTIRQYPKFAISRIVSIAGINHTTAIQMLDLLFDTGFIIKHEKGLALSAKAGSWLTRFEALNLEVSFNKNEEMQQ
jgi:predicted transcriptional regulator